MDNLLNLAAASFAFAGEMVLHNAVCNLRDSHSVACHDVLRFTATLAEPDRDIRVAHTVPVKDVYTIKNSRKIVCLLNQNGPKVFALELGLRSSTSAAKNCFSCASFLKRFTRTRLLKTRVSRCIYLQCRNLCGSLRAERYPFQFNLLINSRVSMPRLVNGYRPQITGHCRSIYA